MRPERRIRTLHLAAPEERWIGRGAGLVEDALRTASLPWADTGRLLLVRSVDLGTFSASAAPATVALMLERRLRELIPVHASHPHAPQAAAVWFRDAAEAHVLLAVRLVRGEEAAAWFWRLAVPAWQPGMPRSAALRALLLSALATPAGPAAALELVRALRAAGGLDLLALALSPVDGPHLLRACGWRIPDGAGAASPAVRGAAAPVPASWAEGWGWEDARTVWLAAMLRAVEPSPPIPIGADFGVGEGRGGVFPRPEEVLGRSDGLVEGSREVVGRSGKTNGQSDELVGRSEEGVGRSKESSDGPGRASEGPKRFSDGPTRSLDSPSSPSEGPDRSSDGPTKPLHGGMRPQGEGKTPPRPSPALTRGRGRPLPPSPTAKSAPMPPTPLPPFTPFAGLFLLLPVLVRLGLAGFLDENPHLLEAGFPARFLDHIAHRVGAGEDDPVRRALPIPEGEIDGQEALLRTWRIAARRWCRRRAGIGFADLVRRPGRVSTTRTHVDVFFDPRQVEMRVRRAGLDLDPGWVPWLGRVVLFHYEQPPEVVDAG